MFSIAESYALSHLTPDMRRSRRVVITVELSRTLATHAEFASEHQQQDLWKRAQSIVDDERNREPTDPFAIVLSAQSAMVPAEEANWLQLECELRPFDEPLAERMRQRVTLAIQLLSQVEQNLLAPHRNAPSKRDADAPTSHELRVWLHRIRLALAQSLRNRAELSPADSRERTADLIDAELTARKLVNAADEPTPFRAKLLLADCLRLKGDLNRADEALTVLEKGLPDDVGTLLEEVVAVKARVLLDRHRPDKALAAIVQVRSDRQRLTGLLWFLQTRALLSMRNLATAKKDPDLASKLREQAEVTLQRCDDQVGGFWARRCRQLWEATQTSEKYGPELDAQMQQARTDFLAGRTESALKNYARAELTARGSAKPELALELGYTRASILLQQKQYDAGAKEFLRLAEEYPQSVRTASAHLNGAYCLGRLYDEQKTPARREQYTATLDRHLEQFPADPTSDEARFLKAQFEEQRLQASAALPLYLKISATHPRYPDALAGAARCYEAIAIRMRGEKLPSAEFERGAISALQNILPTGEAPWPPAICEVALHLAALQLLSSPPRFDKAELLLSRVVQMADQATNDDAEHERWTRLKQRAGSLRVVALAGSGKPAEAERLIDSLASAAPRDLLVIVERLAPFVASESGQMRIQYVALQLRAVELLARHRSALSGEEQDQLDQSVARVYLASGQLSKAVEIYERQATAAAQDINRQREIAILLADLEPRECTVLARKCWHRVESLTKRGSPEWLTARLGVIQTGIQLDELAESKKLLILTKILYPELGGEDLKARFQAAEKKLSVHQ
ncbi:MAG: hypothetical protein JSS49_13630 [Planctomycetes bacterium]|nr:hypothetical protein [Planctomycetota bacterium]